MDLVGGRGASPTPAQLLSVHVHPGTFAGCVDAPWRSELCLCLLLGIAKAKLEPRRLNVQQPTVKFDESDAYN